MILSRVRRADCRAAALPQQHSTEPSSVNQLRQCHARLIQHALHRHSYWVARLIAHCTHLRAPRSYACCIFESAHRPDATVFTNMIVYYSKLGASREVLKVFDEMQKCDPKPDSFPFPTVIKAAGKNGCLFHSGLIKMGIECGKYVRNALVNAYGKYGPIEAARQVFNEMPERSVADWNSIISGYWNWGIEGEAKRLFDRMPERNVITWTAMVTGYSRMEDVRTARSYFDRIQKKNVSSWNAMISGYGQNGYLEEALSLFDEMESVGLAPNETTWATLISSCSSRGDPALAEAVARMLDNRGICLDVLLKTALLDLYAKCGCLEMARNIFNELGEKGNSVTWNSMISAYTRAGDLVAARAFFDQMSEKDVISWNSMIAGYAQNGEPVLAFELFKEMVSEDVIPDGVTMVSVISACGNLGALELGNWVVGFMKANHIKLSTSGYCALIFMYSKCGCMAEAKQIFHKMDKRDVNPYNALITGFAVHGNGIEALKLMQIMKDKGIEPDRITYIGVLTACSHAGLLEEGRDVFESMKAPDVTHYTCMVDLLGRAGKLNEAKIMVDKMPMQPNAEIYGSLLNASQMHKRIDLGMVAANKLFELEPEQSGNYVLLSNIYASAGKWKQVERIRKLMKTKKLTKTVGWSWMEHDREIHRFTVGDRSHKESVQIYNVLGELRRKLQASGYIPNKSNALRDVDDEEKEEMVGTHSEKLAVAFGLLVSEPGTIIRVVKNMRICWDCHAAIKIISRLEEREIVVRDNSRFHCFKDGACSCSDYW